jgi:hypothetical protein
MKRERRKVGQSLIAFTNPIFHVAGVATVSSESVEAGAWGGEVSCGLALVPVVAAEAEAAAAAEDEEVEPRQAGGSRDFARWRRDLHPHPHFHLSLPLSLINFSLPYGGGELEGVRHRSPEKLSTSA